MANNDKYRSPYDPRFSGKIKEPPEQKPPEPVQSAAEQHGLYGCGDPACPRCNPETARRGVGRARFNVLTFEDLSRGGFTETFRAELTAALKDQMLGRAGSLMPSPPSKPAPKAPPQSYTAAREKVERFITPIPAQAFDDIVGNDEALSLLRDAIAAPVRHKALYDAYGMKMPKGALLSGPPGCGKTMFARAAAAEMKALYGEATEFISLGGSDIQSMYVGETERQIKAIFTFAREYKAFHGHPLMVFLDEAEVLLPDRTGRIRRVASWEESQVAVFLAEMDGVQDCGAFVLLATNRPEVIDQAVLRDGRCDFKIVVQRPTPAATQAILTKGFAKVLLGEDSRETLVMAAHEALYDPHKVLREAHALTLDIGKGDIANPLNKHFLLEHIVSGAMAASIPTRATRYAFARDKESGEAKGVTVADVVRAVNDLYQENKTLDHAFALEEFKREFMAELRAQGVTC